MASDDDSQEVGGDIFSRMSHWDPKDPEMLGATSEAFRIHVDQTLGAFLRNGDAMQYSFPGNLSNLERKFVHQKAMQYNLISRSHGKDPNRVLSVYKRGQSLSFKGFFLELTQQSKKELEQVERLPSIVPAERVLKPLQNDRMFGNLLQGKPPGVKEPRLTEEIEEFRRQLPIHELKPTITSSIRSNSVVIISSETGSGKTTQIPQYIMDECRSRNEPCRIVCTQPRRISALSVAERVSRERGEKLGDSIGYHVRFESNFSRSSNVIYCTSGVLVRSLTSDDMSLFNSLTHVIIDEVHERDKLSDFLLVCMKQQLANGAPIKLILMSATVNVEKLKNYFSQADVINVPGRLFSIREVFLEEILEFTHYQHVLRHKIDFMTFKEQPPVKSDPNQDRMLEMVLETSSGVTEQIWTQLLQLIYAGEVDVNYQHSTNGMTAIMAAVCQEKVDMVEKLCAVGCNPHIKSVSGQSAFSLAESHGQHEMLEIMKMAGNMSNVSHDDLSEQYYKTCSDDEIDYDLLGRVISIIHRQCNNGSILVFLPGYDDIMMCYDRITELPEMDPDTYRVFFLHGSMDIREQHEVFRKIPKRKIILSTNIAETSLTIDDVVYVVDCGKAKVLTYDSYSGLSSLQTQWISKACVKQRAGRAGRTQKGICFHLFSTIRYDSFLAESIPEMLRVPLEELCLNTKSLIGDNESIYEFLSLALDPPSANTVKTAIENLECLGALDKEEKLTALGRHLAQLSIEPHLGKMLIYAVIFRCFDPVITIVASMAQKDPFQLPSQANLRTQAAERRKSLMCNTFSDHMIYLQAFIKWQESMTHRNGYNFSRDYFISCSTMETILKTRSQLHRQLRASHLVTANGKTLPTLNRFSSNWPLIKAIVASGLYPKVAFRKNGGFSTRTENKVSVHNSNPLSKQFTDLWLVYDEMVKSRNNHQLKNVTPVTPLTVALFCGMKAVNPTENSMEIDEWLEFEFAKSHAVKLRSYMDWIVARKLANPTTPSNEIEEKVLAIVANVLMHEERHLGFGMPPGINEKPRYLEMQKRLPNDAHVDGRHFSRQNGARSTPPSTYAKSSTSTSSRSSVRSTPSSANGERSTNGPVFLLIDAKELRHVQIAQLYNKWVFSAQTEKKIIALHRSSTDVFLFYKVKSARVFCGVAKFRTFDSTGGRMRGHIEWIARTTVPFNKSMHLRNSLDDLRLVNEGVDGQAIDSESATKLFDMFFKC